MTERKQPTLREEPTVQGVNKRLTDIANEALCGDLLLIKTREKIELSMYVVQRVIRPASSIKTFYAEEICTPESDDLYLSPIYHINMFSDTCTNVELDLKSGRIWGNGVIPDSSSDLKVTLPLHFIDYEILRKGRSM